MLGYLATLVTGPPDRTPAALRHLAAAPATRSGADRLGVHVGGPFRPPDCSGSHPATWLRSPDAALLEQMLVSGPVRVVTLAPELQGAVDLISACSRAACTSPTTRCA